MSSPEVFVVWFGCNSQLECLVEGGEGHVFPSEYYLSPCLLGKEKVRRQIQYLCIFKFVVIAVVRFSSPPCREYQGEVEVP